MPTLEAVNELTRTQHGMLVHCLSEPDADHYLVQAFRDLTGPVDLRLLRRAVELLHELHPALRSAFMWQGIKQPVQVVTSRVRPDYTELDLTPDGADPQDQRWRDLLGADRSRGLRLDAPTPCRWTVVRLGPERLRILFTHHHLLLDGISLALAWRDLAQTYAHLCDPQQPMPGARPPVHALLAWRDGRDRWSEELFWQDQLRDLDTREIEIGQLERRTDEGWGEERHALPERLLGSLRTLARTRQVSLNSVLHAAWCIQVARYTNADDVVVGTVFAGRPDALVDAQQMVGTFLNTLPLRLRVPGDATAVALIQAVHGRLTELRAYQDTSLSEALQFAGLPTGRLVFDSIVVSESYPLADPAEWGTARSTPGEVLESPHFPLTLVLRPEAGEVVLRHDGRRFTSVVARRILDHFLTLLETLTTADPDTSVRELAMLPEHERRDLERHAGRPAAGTWRTPMPEAFAASVGRTPDVVAVRDGDRMITYRQLAERADRLAAGLIERGVRPGSVVAVSLAPSMAAVVTVLAVWRAGAVYLPLDPGQPEERLRFIVRDAGAVLVVTGDRPGWADDLPVVRPDLVTTTGPTTGDVVTDPQDVAYIIYTSGSTGEPKGVRVQHGPLAHYVWWAVDRYLTGADGGVPLHSSLAFDLGLTSLLCPLAAGRTIVVAPPEGLADLLAGHHRFAFVKVTPAHLGLLSTWPGVARAAATARTWVVGGEALHHEQTAPWLRAAPETVMINEYGPTEAVVGCCVHTVTSPPDTGPVPIGRPIDGARLYVLDRSGHPTPIGMPGELHIAGPALAAGYVNRPELTAQRFLPDCTGQPGRMYRTGDLACLTPDGTLHYLGRRDDQVKIRGYRVELGEIEARTRATGHVGECKVMLRRDPEGQERLVSYVVPTGDRLDETALRELLARNLPAYMLPERVVRLATMPLTRNGKVDVAALPSPEWTTERAATSPPRTATERLVADIWARLLGVGSVGPDDDFFCLGGHSLLAARVVNDVQAGSGVWLPVSKIFQLRTVAELAAWIDAEGAADPAPPAIVRIARRAR
ncbi:amino acid adenylation domain-containing protein [Micromonospora sp. PSH03]|uniref:non-ribosomal peptide synthetase n=1 Tax=Micromonospora salmantinae TaxID=2911211 RepID=UPI001EE93CA3|nr:amino acid adenylation domain-containing protein [Micromonospora salmantinae]MCG5454699.1 amino acid adenylation domain-containing protein [Micromonospora salmantinae]